jgi:hypothetical protein
MDSAFFQVRWPEKMNDEVRMMNEESLCGRSLAFSWPLLLHSTFIILHCPKAVKVTKGQSRVLTPSPRGTPDKSPKATSGFLKNRYFLTFCLSFHHSTGPQFTPKKPQFYPKTMLILIRLPCALKIQKLWPIKKLPMTISIPSFAIPGAGLPLPLPSLSGLIQPALF